VGFRTGVEGVPAPAASAILPNWVLLVQVDGSPRRAPTSWPGSAAIDIGAVGQRLSPGRAYAIEAPWAGEAARRGGLQSGSPIAARVPTPACRIGCPASPLPARSDFRPRVRSTRSARRPAGQRQQLACVPEISRRRYLSGLPGVDAPRRPSGSESAASCIRPLAADICPELPGDPVDVLGLLKSYPDRDSRCRTARTA